MMYIFVENKKIYCHKQYDYNTCILNVSHRSIIVNVHVMANSCLAVGRGELFFTLLPCNTHKIAFVGCLYRQGCNKNRPVTCILFRSKPL